MRSMLFGGFLGRLNLDALRHGPVEMVGVVMMSLGLLTIVGLLTYTKRWKWLWRNWLTSLDPKRIGVMYLLVAFVMLLRGISDALMMRAQQVASVGESHGFLQADHFQQVFTAHGSMMIFFVAMGLMFGLINLVLPLQLGARDVAFPFLNATSFWLYCAGAVLMNVSLPIGEFAATGWLAYPPLSELQYSPGVGVDYWIWSIQIAGIGSLLSGVNFITTILRMRAPGMTLMKMPMFSWSVLGSMILVAFAFPILTVTLAMLSLDRTMGMHFFTSTAGGNPMMYVNLIWAWGHPEVYILVLPAFGIFSEVVATFSSKRLFGYTSMVWAIMSIVFFSYTVWLHHFFTMGSGADVNAFFGIMTMLIAIPTGVKVFNWLFTMFRGRVRFTTPMLWFFGFVVTFTIGGATGVLMSMPPVDFQLHNSLFLVAHFHNMIIGGVVFGYFAGFSYWFPKIFGFRLNERLGIYAFWCWIIGFLLAFVPLYILGFMGATRRLDHYDASLGWQQLFIVAGVGVVVILIGVGFQVAQLAYSIWRGVHPANWKVPESLVLGTSSLQIAVPGRLMRLAQRLQRWLDAGESEITASSPRGKRSAQAMHEDPWDARTLEWSTASPVPAYNFATLPDASLRDAFWEAKVAGNDRPTGNYQDVALPKNSPFGLYLALGAGAFGFAVVWHIWWLALASLLAVMLCMVVRSQQDETEYVITAAEIQGIERSRSKAGKI